MSSFALDMAFRAIDKVSAPAKDMSKNIKSFGRTAENTMRRAQVATRQYINENRRASSGLSKIGSITGFMGGVAMATMLLGTASTATVELDKNLASLQAITGVNDTQFESFKKQVNATATQHKMFSGDVAKAYEVVASAQPILLENAEALGKVTDAAITLSKASGDELAESAEALTGTMNQFGLGVEHAERVMNTLAAGSVAGSAGITKVSASMKNFGAVASSSNISVEEAVALVETMGTKSIFAEEAGTKLSSAVLNLQKAGVGYQSGVFDINDALAEMSKRLDETSSAKERDNLMMATFGKTGMVAGQVLMNNIEKYKELKIAVTGTTTAIEQSEINSNTLADKIEEVSNAFRTSISNTLTQTDKFQGLKDAMKLVSENMDKIMKIAHYLAIAFGLWLAKIILVNTAMLIMNGLLAISKFMKFIKVIKMMAKAKGTWVAIQWALNAAMSANPIGLIAIAIVALIAIIIVVIKYWREIYDWLNKVFDSKWGRLAMAVFSPILFVGMAIARNWDNIKDIMGKAFDFIWEGAKNIGKFLYDMLITPLKWILKAGSTLGINVASDSLKKLEDIEANLFGNNEEDTSNNSGIINRDATYQNYVMRERQQQSVGININNNNNSDISVEDNGFPVNIIANSIFKNKR